MGAGAVLRYRRAMNGTVRPVGDHLREWRQRRRMSQLDLACEADISTRHLSFLETGRSLPSRDMILHLADRLEIPLRERNMLLVAAGYAPMFPERSLEDPALQAARKAVELLLAGHEPNPALAVDRHWNIVASNRALAPMMDGIAPELLQPPVNAMRISLHPAGLAPRVLDFAEWRAHWLARLRHQIDISADPKLVDLVNELQAYPLPAGAARRPAAPPDLAGVAFPFRVATQAGVLSFITTNTVFGTPIDITLSELSLESMFPADPATAEILRRLHEERTREPAAAE